MRFRRPAARLAVFAALTLGAVMDTVRAQDLVAGAGAFLPKPDVERALARQRDFLARLEADAQTRARPGTPEYLARIRAGLAQAAPGVAKGRDIGGTPEALGRVDVKVEDHDRDPRLQQTLTEFLEEGRRGKRIFGGASPPPGVFRETVAIVERRGDRRVCTGTLISKDAILTAAHCVCGLRLNAAGTDAVIRVGDDMDVLDGNNRQLRLVPSGTRMLDPNFCRKAGPQGFVAGYDIAVIRIDPQDAEFKVNIDPNGPAILRPNELQDRSGAMRVSAARLASHELYFANRRELMIVGFGLNDRAVEKDIGIKMYADVPVYSAICGSIDLDYQVGCAPGREALLIDWQYHQRDTCRGDSGGPAFIRSRDNTRYFLAAVTSRAVDQSGEARCGPGGIYTLVTPGVIAWLRSLGIAVAVEGAR